MGCGASKKGMEEALPTRRPQNTEVANQEQQEKQGENENPNDKTDLKKKTKGKKSTKTAPGDPQEDDNDRTGIGLGKKNRQLWEQGDLSNLDNLPEYEAKVPVGFGDGDLSPIGANKSSIGKKSARKKKESHELTSFEQEMVNRFGDRSRINAAVGKQVRVKRQKMSLFNWPDKGEVEIKTISFKAVYNQEIKGFRTIKSKDSYLNSQLTWYKDEDEDLFECSIKDIAATDLRTGNNTFLKTPQINFQVDTDGKFVGVKDIDKFVENLLEIQSTGRITMIKQKELEKTIVSELEKTWNMAVQEWVHLDKPENEDVILDRSKQFGKDCYLLNRIKTTDEADFREKLKEKLMDPTSYYKILASNKMIKDKFKKWELHKDSVAKPKKLDENGNEIPPHRNLKLNFIFTDKDEVITSLMEVPTIQPLIINYSNAKKIVFEVNRDLYIDVEYEARMSIYQWKGVEGLQNDEFLISEMIRFQDACNQAIGDLITEISSVPKIPLKFRLEKVSNDQVFEREENKELKKKEARRIRRVDEASEGYEDDEGEYEEQGERQYT